MFGSAARGTSHPAPGEYAGPGASCGAGEEGQEEGHGNPEEFPALGVIGFIVR